MEKSNNEGGPLSEELKKRTEEAVKTGRVVSERLERAAKEALERTKASPTMKKLRLKTKQAKKAGIKEGKKFRAYAPPMISRIGNKFLSALEKFIGAIRRGTQYGKTSLETLEQFAKMKELGIITEEEFEKKKKEILDRI